MDAGRQLARRLGVDAWFTWCTTRNLSRGSAEIPQCPRRTRPERRRQVRNRAWDGSCTAHHNSGIPARRDAVTLPAQIAKEEVVLYTIAVVLLILWLLGLVSGYTIGAFIHVLLVIALVLVLVQFVSGRRVV
jgi:uncharacterized protein DUF5670